MAYVHCTDETSGYCFSLSRIPHEEHIELMVYDQLVARISDLPVVFTGHAIHAELHPELASRLDGVSKYEINLLDIDGRRSELISALHKIFEGKTGFRDLSAT